ncbi:MAG: lysophospholipid acyltransferase family protein [Devosia sp.]
MTAEPQTKDSQGPDLVDHPSVPAYALALVRTVIYSVVSTTYFFITTTLFVWVFLLPARTTRPVFTAWARGDIWLLRLIVGQKMEVIGRENIPTTAALVASKHQSAWETYALLPLLPEGVIFLKKELLRIPIYGWYARHYGMIPIDRSAGSAALKQLVVDAGAALARGVQIVIFPEGTRRPVGAPPDYKPGAMFLYEKLKVPAVPVALNSGLLWPHKRYVKYPGTVRISFLPAIAPGLDRRSFKDALIGAIETETDRLVAMGR